jgi:tetratricopeptide (TPR) repeat protein
LWIPLLILVLVFAAPGGLRAESAALHNTTGLAYFYQGKYVEAFREFVAALKRDPSFAAPHFNLGRVYEKQGRFEEAKEQYRQCLQLDPGHQGAKSALSRLGTIAVRPAPEQEPPPPPEALDLGAQKKKVRTWFTSGKLAPAEKRLYQLLKIFPRDAELHDLLARIFEKQGRLAAALAESQKAALFSPGSATKRYRNAANLFRLGQFEGAIKEATRASELAPADFRIYFLLGLAYQRLDKLEEAFVNFEEAARINPQDKAVRTHLSKLANHMGLYNYNAGLYHFAARNWEEAKKHLDLALRKGNLNDEQRAIAQQYLIVSDFSSQDIASQIRDLQADRRNEQRGFVQKKLTFEEVERSPTIWRKGYYVDFRGRVAYISRNRREILVETDDEVDIRSASELKTWFKVVLPEPLPRDPRIDTSGRQLTRSDATGANRIQVQGKLQRPTYLTNPWNKIMGREPQPVVKATFLTFRAEDNLAGDLRIDYLQLNRAKAKVGNPGPATPLFPSVGSPIPVPLLLGN